MRLTESYIVKDVPESCKFPIKVGDEIDVYTPYQDWLHERPGLRRIVINKGREFTYHSHEWILEIMGTTLIHGRIHYYMIFTDKGIKYDITLNGAPHLYKVDAVIFSYKELSRKQFLELEWFDTKMEDIIKFIKEYKPEEKTFTKIKKS